MTQDYGPHTHQVKNEERSTEVKGTSVLGFSFIDDVGSTMSTAIL